MSKKDRNGNRKGREQRSIKRTVDLGYYLIITDTKETERCYFDGLHKDLPEEIQKKLIVKVVDTKTPKLIDVCLKEMTYLSQYCNPWIVFDRDQVKNFDQIIKEAEDRKINVGWSNPCFEIWLYTYFGQMPAIQESKICCSRFGDVYEAKTRIEYKKEDQDIYQRLKKYGDEEKALIIAKQRHDQASAEYTLPSDMCPCTTVYKLVEEILEKQKQNKK